MEFLATLIRTADKCQAKIKWGLGGPHFAVNLLVFLVALFTSDTNVRRRFDSVKD